MNIIIPFFLALVGLALFHTIRAPKRWMKYNSRGNEVPRNFHFVLRDNEEKMNQKQW